ncbi:radical SAM protein [Pseudoclostridium thermosuccinogenes]|uniref:elongator complex protein 3 n=1 Tax=Clostridium thermosuccinogenes TaxID=84032 RepID=UPI000CCBFCDD|nr:radical SAM protein [Pseudoclostridium thermosuccinogenes]PNT92876.1 radical SAM protein [Pseudoclostridium thermosuccinogenes]
MKSRHIVIPVFVPHKGCPFDCIYCNQRTISGQIREMTMQEMQKIIEDNLSTVKDQDYVEIGFYGGSFTGIEKDRQIEYLETANRYVKAGKVKALRLSTRPDYINAEILEYLKKYNVATIELGVQSLDQEVLDKSCRGHSVEDVIKASGMIREYGINLGLQTMIGLPGDNAEKDIDTARKVIALKPDIVRIYPTLVIKGTYLEKMYNEGKYKPLSLEDASSICAELLDMYEANGINVIRVGLQPTDNINEDMDVVAGPFHPAFRQLVESKRLLWRMEKQIKEKNLEGREEIIIYAGKEKISDVIGQKRANINYLAKTYNFKRILVKENNSLDIIVKG